MDKRNKESSKLQAHSSSLKPLHSKWETIRPYAFVLPSLVFFLLFFLYPIGSMFYLSFTDWTLLNIDAKQWVGLENFKELFGDADFRHVLKNTIVYMLFTVSISLTLSFFLALWLNKKAKIYSFVQGAIFTPHIISLVSISMLWLWLMDPEFGMINAILNTLGIPKFPFLADPKTSLASVIMVSIWKGAGYNTLVFIAGLQSIPKDIYEAAALDRFSKLKTLFKITIPMLSPTLFFLLVINTISSFQVFDTIYIMTQGGPVNSTSVLVFYIYEQGMEFYNGGIASAASVVLLGLIAIMTVIHFSVMSKRVHYR